jgi:hypothetical protein
MAKNQSSEMTTDSGTRKIIEGTGIIEVSRKAVRIGDDVYQLINVTGFGGTEVDAGNQTLKVPKNILFIVALFGVGLFYIRQQILGIICIGAAIFLWWLASQARPKKFGFGLYLNSGEVRVITTLNREFVESAVKLLYNAIENNFPEGKYVLNISGGTIQVGEGNKQKIVSYAKPNDVTNTGLGTKQQEVEKDDE